MAPPLFPLQLLLLLLLSLTLRQPSSSLTAVAVTTVDEGGGVAEPETAAKEEDHHHQHSSKEAGEEGDGEFGEEEEDEGMAMRHLFDYDSESPNPPLAQKEKMSAERRAAVVRLRRFLAVCSPLSGDGGGRLRIRLLELVAEVLDAGLERLVTVEEERGAIWGLLQRLTTANQPFG